MIFYDFSHDKMVPGKALSNSQPDGLAATFFKKRRCFYRFFYLLSLMQKAQDLSLCFSQHLSRHPLKKRLTGDYNYSSGMASLF